MDAEAPPATNEAAAEGQTPPTRRRRTRRRRRRAADARGGPAAAARQQQAQQGEQRRRRRSSSSSARAGSTVRCHPTCQRLAAQLTPGVRQKLASCVRDLGSSRILCQRTCQWPDDLVARGARPALADAARSVHTAASAPEASSPTLSSLRSTSRRCAGGRSTIWRTRAVVDLFSPRDLAALLTTLLAEGVPLRVSGANQLGSPAAGQGAPMDRRGSCCKGSP